MQFFAEPLLLLVFGPQFEEAVPVLRWAAAFPILSATSCLFLHLLYYAKQGSHSVRARVPGGRGRAPGAPVSP